MITYELRKKAKSDDLVELEWKRFRREREGFSGAFRKKKKKKKKPTIT
jgi:ribosomal protein L44E